MIIPPAKSVPPRTTERLIPVSELDFLARGCFPVRVACSAPRNNAHLLTHRDIQPSIEYSQLYILRHIIPMKICLFAVSEFSI